MARSLCANHYANQRRRGGNPAARHEQPLDVRLREIGWTVTETGCWEWNGSRKGAGYGRLTYKRLGLDQARVHRLVYKHLFGNELEDDQLLRHKCDNPPCVNPDHLIPGSHGDNVADMMSRGRHFMQNRKACRHGHDLTLPGATRTYRGRKECCSECIKRWQRNSNEKNREYHNAWAREKRRKLQGDPD